MVIRRLILVDAMAVIYRGFFAIKHLSNRQGRPTNAVFGFIKMLRQLSSIWKPTHWAVVFDGGLPKERTEVLPEYKAQRPPMPDDMRGQLPLCEEYLSHAGIHQVRLEGQEADDVMATIASAAESVSDEVLIASTDKDLFQIVNQRIRMIPVAGDSAVSIGPAEVVAKTGVEPAQIVDWIALMGDTVDNIPGVPGVGGKTAAMLLGQHGTAEGALAACDSIAREKLRKALSTNQEMVKRNLGLVRLRRDISMDVNWDDFVFREPLVEKLKPFYQDLDFGSLLKDLEQRELF
jgi:DNA polymerase I